MLKNLCGMSNVKVFATQDGTCGRIDVFALQDMRARAHARVCVFMCVSVSVSVYVCVREEIENATLNASRTKIYCYQLTPCHARGVSESVCSFHILLLHPALFFVLLRLLFVNHFLNSLPFCKL